MPPWRRIGGVKSASRQSRRFRDAELRPTDARVTSDHTPRPPTKWTSQSRSLTRQPQLKSPKPKLHEEFLSRLQSRLNRTYLPFLCDKLGLLGEANSIARSSARRLHRS